jgi:hypothetical protein
MEHPLAASRDINVRRFIMSLPLRVVRLSDEPHDMGTPGHAILQRGDPEGGDAPEHGTEAGTGG